MKDKAKVDTNIQPYFFTKQFVALALAVGIALVCRLTKNENLLRLVLSYGLVVLFVTFEPYVKNKLSIPKYIHVFLYVLPMILPIQWVLEVKAVSSINIEGIGVALITLLLLSIVNKRGIFDSFLGEYGRIPISKSQLPLELLRIIVPIVSEEIYFRAYLIELTRQLSPVIAISISTILFVLTHYLNRWANVTYTLKDYAAFCFLGIALGYAYFYTSSFALCVTAHMLFDITAFIKITRRFVSSLRGNNESLFNDYEDV